MSSCRITTQIQPRDLCMTDSLLASTDIEEALSRVYVQAVAARAGYTTADYSQDRDGIDILIRAGGRRKDASGHRHTIEGDD